MTDKVQKIRKEVERLRNLHQMKYQQLDADNSMSLVECGKRNLCNELLSFIDSLQEEPKLKPKFQEGNKIVYVGERKELDTDEHTILYVYDDMYVTTFGEKIPFKFQDDYKLVEEPVSEYLEEAAFDYAEACKYEGGEKLLCVEHFKAGAKWQKKRDYIPLSDDINEVAKQICNKVLNCEIDYKEDDVVLSDEEECVKAGIRWQMQKESIPSKDLEELINSLSKRYPEVSFAKLSRIAVRVAKWQEEQFEKNRLAHCDAQTEEEAEREWNFCMSILNYEHRQPTYDDAIKYGMRLQKEQMMAKAIDAQCFGFQGAALFSFRLPAGNYLVGSEVKVIVIKED